MACCPCTPLQSAAAHAAAEKGITEWMEKTEGYFDEDDFVDPSTGEAARIKAKQKIEEMQTVRVGRRENK
jgi:hypothetical protein